MISKLSELDSAVAALIRKICGVNQAIKADQARSQPRGTYATYNIIPISAIGHTRKERALVDAEEPGPDGWQDYAEKTITQLQCFISVNVIGNDSESKAMRIFNADYREPVKLMLRDAGITWVGSSNIRNLSALSRGDVRRRFQADIDIVIETQMTDTVLRAAGFSVEIQDESGNILIDEG